jgi:hypothetical protein
MHIREINTQNRRDVRKFIRFPLELYRDSPEWTPPLVSSVKLTLDRQRHPFYSDSDAAFFLAEEGESVVGRIAVLDNRRYNNYIQGKVAFFYYFDTVEDVPVVEGLFAAVKAWAGKRGLEVLKGPKGFVRSDAYGVLVEGYEHPASMGIPYNYSYYASLLEQIGGEKEVDYFTGYMTAADELPERLFRLAERIKVRRGFWVKNFTTKRELRRWIPRIQEVNNKAFTQVWGYYPIGDAEIQMIGQQLLLVSDPRLLKVVMKGDEIAGFAFVFPDIAKALRKVQGRLFPFGWAPILISLRTTDSLLGNGVGLLPQFQGLGASALLYAELHDTIRSRSATYFELVQVLESNLKSLGDMNMLGVHWHKIHRVFRLQV